MKLNQNLGVILLSVWLIATGLLSVVTISFPAQGLVLGIVALAAGVLILLKPASMPRNIGTILLAVFLIVSGLLPLIGQVIPSQELIVALLALAAGILLLLQRR